MGRVEEWLGAFVGWCFCWLVLLLVGGLSGLVEGGPSGVGGALLVGEVEWLWVGGGRSWSGEVRRGAGGLGGGCEVVLERLVGVARWRCVVLWFFVF